jgi:signal transduction histidine kinase
MSSPAPLADTADVRARDVVILLLDDNRDDRDLARRVLQKHFAAVRFLVANATDELHAVLEAGGFDLAVTDYRLNWTDGLTVLDRIRARFREVPVIMFTNTGSEEVCAEGMRRGLADYVIKRADQFAKLPYSVQAALEQRAARRRLQAQHEALQQREAEASALLLREREARMQAEIARAEALRATRLKDEFLATLSHELRTPLNAILGWTHVIASKATDDSDLKAGIEVIRRNAHAQARLIDDLLDMSRIVSGQLRIEVQRLDLSRAIASAVEAVQPAADRKNVRVQQVLDAGAGPVHGDPARIQQIVWNLLTNAVKFTPSGGRVQVRLEREASRAVITVADNGAGMPAEFLPHAFDRFTQLDSSTTRRHSGLGLGLAIVKNLAELHGGTVSAYSEGLGRGSEFKVSLPVAILATPTAETAAEATPVEMASGVALEGVSVLMVDDDVDTCEVVARVLTAHGAQVRSAHSSREAIALLKQSPPTVLLSDIGMPEEDGLSLIRRVRALAPEQGGAVPAAAISAFARSEDRQRALLAGFDSYTVKPVEPGELLAVVLNLASAANRRLR